MYLISCSVEEEEASGLSWTLAKRLSKTKAVLGFKPHSPQVNQGTKVVDKVGIVFNKVVLGFQLFIR